MPNQNNREMPIKELEIKKAVATLRKLHASMEAEVKRHYQHKKSASLMWAFAGCKKCGERELSLHDLKKLKTN